MATAVIEAQAGLMHGKLGIDLALVATSKFAVWLPAKLRGR
jgi:hypothetical protein